MSSPFFVSVRPLFVLVKAVTVRYCFGASLRDCKGRDAERLPCEGRLKSDGLSGHQKCHELKGMPADQCGPWCIPHLHRSGSALRGQRGISFVGSFQVVLVS